MEYEEYVPPRARSEEVKREAAKIYNTVKKKNISRKFEAQPSDCARFNPHYRAITCRNAISYLKLRKMGCKKQSAMDFCSKAVCRIDLTRKVDGPHNFRKLKPLKRKNPLNINVTAINYFLGMGVSRTFPRPWQKVYSIFQANP